MYLARSDYLSDFYAARKINRQFERWRKKMCAWLMAVSRLPLVRHLVTRALAIDVRVGKIRFVSGTEGACNATSRGLGDCCETLG